MSKLTEALEANPTTPEAVLQSGLIILEGVHLGIIDPESSQHGAELLQGFTEVGTALAALSQEVQDEIHGNAEAQALLNINEVLRQFAEAQKAETGVTPTPIELLNFLGNVGNALLPAEDEAPEA